MNKRISAAILLFCLLIFAPAACAAGKVTFPDVETVKKVGETWFENFREGVKVSHISETVTQVKYGGQDCLLFERTERFGPSSDANAVVKTARILALEKDLAPLFCELATQSPDYKTASSASFTRDKETLDVAVYNKVNDEERSAEHSFEMPEPLYVEALLDNVYARLYLKDKKEALLDYYDVEADEPAGAAYAFVEEKAVGEGDGKGSYAVVETGNTRVWFDASGSVARRETADGMTTVARSSKEAAEKYPASLAGYKPNDAVRGADIVLEKMGVRMKRPSSNYFLSISPDEFMAVLEIPAKGCSLVVAFMPGLYDDAPASDVVAAYERMTASMYPSGKVKFGAGKIDETNALKPFAGALTITVNLHKAKGLYWFFREKGRGVFVTFTAFEKDFAALEKDIRDAVGTLKLNDPKFKFEPQAFYDKTARIGVTPPGPAWEIETDYLEGSEIFLLKYLWLDAQGLAETIDIDEDITPQGIIDEFASHKDIVIQNKREAKVGGLPAAIIDVIETAQPEEGAEPVKYIGRHIVIIRGRELIAVRIAVREDQFKMFEKDLDKIVDSLKVDK